jgi:AcrR family transcriptional regulator
MPPGRKPSHSPADFVKEAIELADIEGISGVTVRSLGTRMNVSATAVYRYFAEKESLLAAMRDELLGQVLSQVSFVGDPKDQILSLAHAYRQTARSHPCLSHLMLLTALTGAQTNRIPQLVEGLLSQMGVHGELATRGYRQFESLVVGTTLFDYSGAPLHLSDRLDRMKSAAPIEMLSQLKTESDIEAVNEAAFNASFFAVLESLIAESRKDKKKNH